jgi:hypothetical protein
MILIASLMLAAAAAPFPKLPRAQDRALVQAAPCPEHLTNNAARIRSVEAFITLYGTFRPQSHAGERMAYRDAILRAKKCRPNADTLIHTFPES